MCVANATNTCPQHPPPPHRVAVVLACCVSDSVGGTLLDRSEGTAPIVILLPVCPGPTKRSVEVEMELLTQSPPSKNGRLVQPHGMSFNAHQAQKSIPLATASKSHRRSVSLAVLFTGVL